MSLSDQDWRYNVTVFRSFKNVPSSEAAVQSFFLQNVLQNLDSFARDRHPEEQFNFLKLLLRSRESPTLFANALEEQTRCSWSSR